MGKDFSSESGHWYGRDGSPQYTIIGANGKERKTTLRDARKLNLLPSVTTVMNLAAKPGLEIWKQEQLLLAALTIPKIEGEPEKEFMKRVRADSKEHGKQAAEKGTTIHGWVERGVAGEYVPAEGLPFVELARAELDKHFPDANWKPEKSFAHERYGGKVDLHDTAVLDIKTNEKPVDGAKLWDEMLMQIAAYCMGLGKTLTETPCGILFINHKDMEAKIVMAKPEQLEMGWEMFYALLNFWYAKTGLRRT